MSRDEEALHWEGDDELDGPVLADDEAAADDAAQADASVALERDARRPGPLGWLMAALALCATAGWIMIVVANPVEQPSLLGLAMYQLGELLAVITPLLWWFTVGRIAKLDARAAWWFAGLVVTAPWPLVAGLLA